MEKKCTFFICLILLLGIACAVNPVTGKRELILYSEQDEIALGKEADIQVKSQYGIYENASLNSYVAGVGQSLAPHTHRPQLSYNFAVLDSPVVNAYIGRQPKRIKLVTADGRRTLQEIFQSQGMQKDLWTSFAIMNGMELNRIPSKDRLVKIVR